MGRVYALILIALAGAGLWMGGRAAERQVCIAERAQARIEAKEKADDISDEVDRSDLDDLRGDILHQPD